MYQTHVLEKDFSVNDFEGDSFGLSIDTYYAIDNNRFYLSVEVEIYDQDQTRDEPGIFSVESCKVSLRDKTTGRSVTKLKPTQAFVEFVAQKLWFNR